MQYKLEYLRKYEIFCATYTEGGHCVQNTGQDVRQKKSNSHPRNFVVAILELRKWRRLKPLKNDPVIL